MWIAVARSVRACRYERRPPRRAPRAPSAVPANDNAISDEIEIKYIPDEARFRAAVRLLARLLA